MSSLRSELRVEDSRTVRVGGAIFLVPLRDLIPSRIGGGEMEPAQEYGIVKAKRSPLR